MKDKFSIIIYKLHRLLLAVIQRGKNIAVRRVGIIGKNTVFYNSAECVNLQYREKLRIGDGTHIRGEIFVYPYGEGLTIGKNCYVGEYSVIRSGSEITIGDNVLIAHGVTIIDNDSHELDHIKRAQSYVNLIQRGHPGELGEIKASPIIIEDYAWISYGVAILKGVKIGRGAIIGANSVVTRDVPPFSVVAGNPARVIRQVTEIQSHWGGG